MPRHLRTRAISLAALVLTIGAGLWTRSPSFPGPSFWAQHVGTALWAVALYWTIRIIAPRWSRPRVFGATLLVAWAVELLQLTPIPRTLSSWHPFFRLHFGEVFDPADMVALAIGAAAAAFLDTLRFRLGA